MRQLYPVDPRDMFVVLLDLFSRDPEATTRGKKELVDRLRTYVGRRPAEHEIEAALEVLRNEDGEFLA